MAPNLPALDATTHVSSVAYECTFGVTVAGPVSFAVPKPVLFTFMFDTGRTQPDPDADLFDVLTDASWFDQVAEEAAIKGALDGICGLIAALLPGGSQPAVQATVTVRRSWRISANSEGTAAPVQIPASPVTYSEIMPYP